ncbi:MAG: aldose epimerase family protein, partial [Bacteroidota bacterium]
MLQETVFGEVASKEVKLFSIDFPGALKAELTNYGGILTSLFVPDREGKLEDVVLGYDNLDQYRKSSFYFGALIGRFANRIADGKFQLDGKSFKLATNNGPNHLHGGEVGFDRAVWEVLEVVEDKECVEIKLRYLSKDGEEGYPGNLTTVVTYVFKPSGFSVKYQAQTDKKTILNLTQHSYFNLSGILDQQILDHEVQINSSQFLPIDKYGIPTRGPVPVKNTPFDFTRFKKVRQDISQDHPQMILGNGYDHSFVLDHPDQKKERQIASVYHPGSGRFMEVLSTEPAVQFYTGNFLEGKSGKNSKQYHARTGLCLETQHFPN